MKQLSLVCAGALLLTFASLPIGYYTFLRILITIGAGVIVFDELKNGIGFWTIIFGLIAILFNPIIPVYLGSKSAWLPIDIVVAIVFIVKAFQPQTK